MPPQEQINILTESSISPKSSPPEIDVSPKLSPPESGVFPMPSLPEICISPTKLRNPSASRWVPLVQQIPPIVPLPVRYSTYVPTPFQSPLALPAYREPSRWVPISPQANLQPRIYSPPVQYEYPDPTSLFGQPQHSSNTSPYYGPSLPYPPAQIGIPQGLTPVPSPTFTRRYCPLPPSVQHSAESTEDLALSPVTKPIDENVPGSAPWPLRKRKRSIQESVNDDTPDLALKPVRKRKRSIRKPDIDCSKDPSQARCSSAEIYSGRRISKSKKLGPPYKYEQTQARKRFNEKRKAKYHRSKLVDSDSDDEGYLTPGITASGKKKGRPYLHTQTRERREKNARRRELY